MAANFRIFFISWANLGRIGDYTLQKRKRIHRLTFLVIGWDDINYKSCNVGIFLTGSKWVTDNVALSIREIHGVVGLLFSTSSSWPMYYYNHNLAEDYGWECRISGFFTSYLFVFYFLLWFSVFGSVVCLLLAVMQGFSSRVYQWNGMVVFCWLLGVGCRVLTVGCRVIAGGGCYLFLVVGYRLSVGCRFSVSAVTRCPQLWFFFGWEGVAVRPQLSVVNKTR